MVAWVGVFKGWASVGWVFYAWDLGPESGLRTRGEGIHGFRRGDGSRMGRSCEYFSRGSQRHVRRVEMMGGMC